MAFKAASGGVSDTTPPTTSITSPASGATVSGTTSVLASASDNVGVTSVAFYLDGVLQVTDTSSPYTLSWNTTTTANGSHILATKAYDAAGNVGTSGSVTVTVDNASPPVITSSLSASATAGSSFSYQIVASNSPASYSASGLPAGLSVNTGTGLVSGTPTSAGTFNITLGATNSAGTGTATLVIAVASSGGGGGTTIAAASCNTSDVQTAINSVPGGGTVIIPAGTCNWTSGVTISGKGITVTGAGSGRILAYDDGIEMLTVGTGTLTVNIAGYSPDISAANITNGETLRVFENAARTNWMQGTVTSLVGSTLTMNITSTGGSGTTHRWLIATIPTTVITNTSNNSVAIFNITEDTNFHTNISGIKFADGGGTAHDIDINYATGGQAVLIHDCWMEVQHNGLNGGSIFAATNRGVIWHCSFDASPYEMTSVLFSSRNSALTSSWTTVATWGAADTTGQRNFYVESNDFHAFLNAADIDDNGRVVWRYNVMDNSGFGTHGPDSSLIGMRYFEYYHNTGIHNGYADGTTFNQNWWIFWRGGTGIVYDNNLQAIASQDYTQADIKMVDMNLQRAGGPVDDHCWGAGTSNGADYHSPRQIGMGYVIGTGKDGYGRTNDSETYVGDSEPVYMWGNNRTLTINIADYGTRNADSCTGSTYDTSANYIKINRDYFNGSTPKPGYTPYTYPDPLRALASGAGGGGALSDTTPPSVPTGLAATAASSTQIDLSWTASTDNVGVTGYKVYRGGTQIGTTAGTTYNDTGLTPATNYTYTVSAYDAAGNTSAQSASASATTQAAPDTTISATTPTPTAATTTSGGSAAGTTSGGGSTSGGTTPLGGGGGGGSSSSAPSPLITNVFISAVTANSALVTVSLSQPASVELQYGQTTAYGQATLPSVYLTTVYLNLANLSPGTVYDFRVTAFPQSGGISQTSPNYVFTTLASAGGAPAGSIPGVPSGSAAGSSGTGIGSAAAPPFPRNLSFSDTGSDVHTLEVVLQNLGYLPTSTPITSSFGSETKHALLLFQRDHQLNRSGFLDLQSQALMNKIVVATPSLAGGAWPRGTASSATAPSSNPSANPAGQVFTKNLLPGMTDDQVTELQTLLYQDGDYPENIISGFFGSLTEQAVQTFQAKYGIVSQGTPATTGYGAVGPKTRAKLNKFAPQYGIGGGNAAGTPPPATSAPASAAPASGVFVTRTLSQGMSGTDVTLLQNLLTKDGVYPGPVTGYFGPLTQQGVQAFQQKHGIVSQGTPDTTGYGLVGPRTREDLNGME